ncbi:MAG: SAM-dependent methyltransferase [Clostridium sp.]|nr:SAM-dependent methyltransferase [Clostridium sp.]
MNNEMIKSECENTPSKYFYFINCSEMEKELCNMEMRSIFGKEIKEKYLFSEKNFDPSRSPFIKLQIKSIYIEKNLQDIINKIEEDKISYDDFKVNYIKSEDGDVPYEERLKAVREIGFVIIGFSDIHNPKIELAITKVKDKWIFGELIKNNYKWQRHNDKPHSYSNAVPLRMARALVNIAVGDNRDLTLVDPCCGVGTVVIEALDLGINVKGYEISKPIACNARNNIEFLGYNREIITSGDMHNINEVFDVAIVDIPYGLFSPVTLKEQVDIINTSRRIARKLVIITFEDMDNLITSAGFKIVEKCYMTKGNMMRQISICE